MPKTLIGPRLRQLRRDHGQTQAEMARRLGISPAYVNLLESNQRSLSVTMLMALGDVYGVDLRDLLTDASDTRLADLRHVSRDPVFAGPPPDLQELRAAIDHAPRLIGQVLQLHRAYRQLTDRMGQMSASGGADSLLMRSAEAAIHDFFRDRQNHFEPLEAAADALHAEVGGDVDAVFPALRDRLARTHRIEVRMATTEDLPQTLRLFQREKGQLVLSEALDHQNRVFQLAHMVGLVEPSQATSMRSWPRRRCRPGATSRGCARSWRTISRRPS